MYKKQSIELYQSSNCNMSTFMYLLFSALFFSSMPVEMRLLFIAAKTKYFHFPLWRHTEFRNLIYSYTYATLIRTSTLNPVGKPYDC